MALLSASTLPLSLSPLPMASQFGASSSVTLSTSCSSGHVRPMTHPSHASALLPSLNFPRIYVSQRHRRSQIVRMAPEEEKMTRRSPLDFPIEWERPKPGRRPDIFPQFSPMKTPLPPPLPADPPEEDEEEEEKKEEEEDDPEKEEPDEPEKEA